MLVTDWLRQFQNRLAFHRRFGRSLKRRRSRRIHSAVESLEVRTLLDGITFSVSGPSTVTEDVSDGDNNEAVYTISYTGTPEIGETVSVNVARLLDDTDSSDFTSDLATSITTAAAGANNVTFDGMTLSFENVSSNASVTASSFVGTVSQGTNGDDAWTSLSSAVGDTPSTFAYVNAHRNDTTNSLRLTDFNLDIPNSATVEGIEVTLLTTGSDNPDNGLGIRLTKNGITAVGTPASSTGSWETGNISIGGAADLWSTTWTAAEVNSANFGMIIDLVGDNNGDQYRVYTAQVSVSYSVAGGAPTSLDFTLGVTADSPSESDESYRIQLTSAGRTGAGTATIDASTVSTTIVNDPAAGNQIPTVSLSNTVTALSESTDTTSRILVADITVVDDAFGTNVLGLSGPNATLFEIENGQLFLKAGTTFDANLLPQIDVSVVVDDNTVGGSPDSTAPLTISVLASLNANDDTATTEMDESVLVDVLANDTGVDVSIASFTQPVNGTVTQVSGQLQYEPDTGFIGIDSFNYTVEDGQGELATAEAVVTVTPVSLTEAVSDSLTFNHTGNGVELDVLANDIGNGLRIVEVTQPLAALITIDPGGDQLVFTPVLTSQTGTVTFDYTIEDDVQVRSTAQVTLNVNGGEGGNFHPVGGDDTATTEMDSPVVIDVLANDTDSTQDPLSLISLTDPAHGTAIIRPRVDNTIWQDWLTNGQSATFEDWYETNYGGSTSLEYDVEYTPESGYIGTDTFTYVVEDDKRAQDVVSVTVTMVENSPPIAVDDTVATNAGQPVVINALANDSDPNDDPLTIVSFTAPAYGIVIDIGGQLMYTPNIGFEGTDFFTYTIEDDNAQSVTATVTVSINSPPVAVDDVATTTQEHSVIIDVTDNDTDPDGDTLTLYSITAPEHGTAILRPDVSDTIWNSWNTTGQNSYGTFDEFAAAEYPALTYTYNVEYTPPVDFVGTDTFSYTMADPYGLPATGTVTVNVVNQLPTATDDTVITYVNESLLIDVLANDSDPDGDAFVMASFTQPQDGTVVEIDGLLQYVPNTDFDGIDTFAYTIQDDQGGLATAIVAVTVAQVDGGEGGSVTAVDDSAVTETDQPVSIDVLANDSDPEGDTFTIYSFTQPHDASVAQSNGQLVFTPDSGEEGVFTFSYTIRDATGKFSTATVTVTVETGSSGGGGSVAAVSDTALTNMDQAVSIDVLANDTDPEGDTFSILSFTQPADGTVTQSGNQLVYTPDPGFLGVNVFTYTIEDATGQQDTASVTVTVEESEVISYDYATFAVDPIGFDLEIPGLGGAISTLDLTGYLDAYLTQLISATSLNINDTLTDGDDTTDVIPGTDGDSKTVNHVWETTLTRVGDGTNYTETLLSTYTITTSWDDGDKDGDGIFTGDGEDYVLVQTGSVSYTLTVTTSATTGITTATLSQNSTDSYEHTRYINTTETDADGDTVTVVGIIYTAGEQGTSVQGGTTSDGVQYIGTTTYSREWYNSDITTTLTTPSGSTIVSVDLADGSHGWTRYDEQTIVDEGALASGPVNLATIWNTNGAPVPLVGTQQTTMWADWQLASSPSPSFTFSISSTISVPTNDHLTELYASGYDNYTSTVTTDLDETETETVDEILTGPDGSLYTLTTTITSVVVATGLSTFEDHASYSLRESALTTLADPEGTSEYEAATTASSSVNVDETTDITVTTSSAHGTSTLELTDHVLLENSALSTTTASGDQDGGQAQTEDSGLGSYNLSSASDFVAHDISEPGVTVDIHDTETITLSGNDEYTGLLVTTQLVGLIAVTETYGSEFSASGTDSDYFASTSSTTVDDDSDPDVSLHSVSTLNISDGGISTWGSASTSIGTATTVEDPDLVAGANVLSGIDDSSYTDNATGNRESSLMVTSIVSVTEDDDGIQRTFSSNDSLMEDTTIDSWSSTASGTSHADYSETRADADVDGTLEEDERQIIIGLSTSDAATYDESGNSSYVIGSTFTATADGTNTAGTLTQTLNDTASFDDSGASIYTLGTTSNVTLDVDDTDLIGGSLTEPEEDPDEVVVMTLLATLNTTSSGGSAFTSSASTTFAETDTTVPDVTSITTLNRSSTSSGNSTFSDTLLTSDALLADETTQSTIDALSNTTSHSYDDASDNVTWDITDESQPNTVITSKGHAGSTLENGASSALVSSTVHLTTIGTPQAGSDEYDFSTTGTTSSTINLSDSADFTTDAMNEDEDELTVENQPGYAGPFYYHLQGQKDISTTSGQDSSSFNSQEDFFFLGGNDVSGTTDVTTSQIHNSTYHVEVQTWEATTAWKPTTGTGFYIGGSSGVYDDQTYIEDGNFSSNQTVILASDLHADGSSSGTIDTTVNESNGRSFTLDGTTHKTDRNTNITLTGSGGSSLNSLIEETVNFNTPADGATEETVERHTEYTVTEQDTLENAYSAGFSTGWLSFGLSYVTTQTRSRNVSAAVDESIAVDGTETESEESLTTNNQFVSGTLHVSGSGGTGGSGGSITVSIDLLADFHQGRFETIQTLDREEIVHDTTSTNGNTSVLTYEMDLTLGDTQTETTTVASSNNDSTQELTLTEETVDGFNQSDLSSVTHTRTPTDHWITYFGDSSGVTFHLHRVLGANGWTADDEFDGEHQVSYHKEDEQGNVQPGAWGTGGTYDETSGSLDYGQAVNPDLNYQLGGSMYPFYSSGGINSLAVALSLGGVTPPAAPMADPVSANVSDGQGGYWIIYTNELYYDHRHYDANGHLLERRTGAHKSLGRPVMDVTEDFSEKKEDSHPKAAEPATAANDLAQSMQPYDVDGDGIADYEDDDLDNDGIPDSEDPDIDGDGVLNRNDSNPYRNRQAERARRAAAGWKYGLYPPQTEAEQIANRIKYIENKLGLASRGGRIVLDENGDPVLLADASGNRLPQRLPPNYTVTITKFKNGYRDGQQGVFFYKEYSASSLTTGFTSTVYGVEVIFVPIGENDDVSEYIFLDGKLRVIRREQLLNLNNGASVAYQILDGTVQGTGAVTAAALFFVPGPEDLVIEGALATKLGQRGWKLVVDKFGEFFQIFRKTDDGWEEVAEEEVEEVLDEVNEVLEEFARNRDVPIYGRPQVTGPGHAQKIFNMATTMAESGSYRSVYMHSKWSTILRGSGVNVLPNRLPDIAGIRLNGKIDIIEIASESDSLLDLLTRNRSIWEQLPKHLRGDIIIIDQLGNWPHVFP